MNDHNPCIVLIASEFSPYAKTGGLGDMVASLSFCLRQKGYDVRVVLPLYGQISQGPLTLHTALPAMCVTMGSGEVWCAVRYAIVEDTLVTRLDARVDAHPIPTLGKADGYSETGLPIYFIEHDIFFQRPGLYHDHHYKDYPDNPRRFGFFCRAALQLIIDLHLKPDILQVHDWQAALVPAYLRTWFHSHPSLGASACLLTIHNAAYQGIFSLSHVPWLGLPLHEGLPDILEGNGTVNFLKAGIHYADAVNTVSPTYAKEIASSHSSPGLASVISKKRERFRGILNGVDYDVWSPEKDLLIPARYSPGDMSGKRICKTHLQRMFRLEENEQIALIGFVGRLAEHKGIHFLKDVIERVVSDMVVQVAILGTGEPEFEGYFAALPSRYPGKIGAYIGFSDEYAHGIEAGADFLVMPSLSEPCGLNQMYSLRYGTLPIVRATGGLNDTVENYDEASGNGTGFKFWDATADALYYTIGWAISTYYDRPHHMRRLMEKAMMQDFSWGSSVRDYEDLFAAVRESKNKEHASIIEYATHAGVSDR